MTVAVNDCEQAVMGRRRNMMTRQMMVASHSRWLGLLLAGGIAAVPVAAWRRAGYAAANVLFATLPLVYGWVAWKGSP